MLNFIHRLIQTEEIDNNVRLTRRTQAPIVKTFVASNQTIAKSLLVFVARDFWNSLCPDIRSIDDHEHFKAYIKKHIKKEYIEYEISKLTL